MTTPRFILGFDAGCGSCAALALAVRAQSRGRIEIRSLTEPAVVALRHQAFAGPPPWAPTLLQVTDDRVRAWSGRRLAFRLARILGATGSWQVVIAIGRLHGAAGSGVGGARFRHALAGARAVGSMVLTGNLAPAPGAADAWVAEARPSPTYDDLTGLPLEIRRAVFRAATPAERSALWTAQLRARLDDRAEIDERQRAALQRASDLVSDVTIFADGDPDAAQDRRIRAVTDELVDAFGKATATDLVTVLGRQTPEEAADEPSRAAACACATASDWCSSPSRCRSTSCTQQSGCGAFWSYTCNGRCS